MRKIANIPQPSERYVRAMICDSSDGVYLFLYTSADDEPCVADHLFEVVADAEEAAHESFGMSLDSWRLMPDHAEGCQQDWIANVRVKTGVDGNPLFGQFEFVVDE